MEDIPFHLFPNTQLFKFHYKSIQKMDDHGKDLVTPNSTYFNPLSLHCKEQIAFLPCLWFCHFKGIYISLNSKKKKNHSALERRNLLPNTNHTPSNFRRLPITSGSSPKQIAYSTNPKVNRSKTLVPIGGTILFQQLQRKKGYSLW